jgi:hypothetical protein
LRRSAVSGSRARVKPVRPERRARAATEHPTEAHPLPNTVEDAKGRQTERRIHARTSNRSFDTLHAGGLASRDSNSPRRTRSATSRQR